jgi:hypothetical protein
MAKDDIQAIVNKLWRQYWVTKKVLINDNLLDVPEDYNSLHMLINALKEVKSEYEKENRGYLDNYRNYSYKHRKWLISSREFHALFNKWSHKYSNDLILS